MLTIEVPRVVADEIAQASVVADRRLYLTEDRATVVEPGDERAAWLLSAPGHSIPGTEVTRLGLTVVDGRVCQGNASSDGEGQGSTTEAPETSETELKERDPGEDKQRTDVETKASSKKK
jgi:hypothetical protein